MQESPNFQNYLNRFQQYNLATLVNDPRQQVPSPHREVIEKAYSAINNYFTENSFRATLTLARKNQIEGQINNIFAQFDQMISYLNQTPPVLIQNIEGVSQNIQAYLDEIDLRYLTPFGLHVATQRKDLPAYVEELNATLESAKLSKEEVEKRLSEADLLIGRGASNELGDHYQILANGMTLSENDQHRRARKFELSRTQRNVLLAIGALLLIGADELLRLFALINLSNTGNQLRLAGLAILLICVCINPLSRMFTRFRPGGYDRAAAMWLGASVIAVIGTGAYASLLLAELGAHADWQALIPKLISLLAPAYFVRFCVQNYRSNKHLFITNTHRATVSRVAKGFSNQISTPIESLKRDELAAQTQIIDRASVVVFEPGETGYITTKEGAGSDSMFDGTPFDGKLNK